MADKTILLVEDEAMLLHSTGKLLGDHFEIIPAISAQTAFDLLLQMHFDCAIIDVNLGDMNGFELVSKLRAKGKKTPVIMVSGRGCEGYKSMREPLGINHCFHKPYDMDALISMINTITA